MKENKTLWIARDKDGSLAIYNHKPERDCDCFSAPWGSYIDLEFFGFQYDFFPEVTWENSPQQVELKLKEG